MNLDEPPDIFISHEAPIGIGLFKGDKELGSPYVRSLVEKLKPKIAFFGHHHTYHDSRVNEIPVIGLPQVHHGYARLDTRDFTVRYVPALLLYPKVGYQFPWEHYPPETLSLLEEGQYDDAIAICECERWAQETLALYVLATARFLKYRHQLDMAATDEVIVLYRRAIYLLPEFADAYLMLGMVCMHKAAKTMRESGTGKLSKAERSAYLQTLKDAEDAMKHAERLNSGFKETVSEQLGAIARARRKVRRWRLWRD